ncbi:MAG: hypothetical protein J7M14_00875 [Planctomycetes bacterium]|nr:hypothetical protein [Planctomycetota bacterium]
MKAVVAFVAAVILACSIAAWADVVGVTPIEVGSGENRSFLHLEFDDGAIYAFAVSFAEADITMQEMFEDISAETTLTYTTLFGGDALYGVAYDGHAYQDWFGGFWSLWSLDIETDTWVYSGTGWNGSGLTTSDGGWLGAVADPEFSYDFSPSDIFLVWPGDADRDADVDATDLAALGLNWAPTATDKTWPEGNFSDDDGDVDATDLASLGLNWNPSGQASALPEPTAAALLAVGAAVVAGRRRERHL